MPAKRGLETSWGRQNIFVVIFNLQNDGKLMKLFPNSGLLRLRRKEAAKKEESRIRNGNSFLEKMISECDGRSNPYSIFSAKELEKATNMYDPHQVYHRDLPFTLYKGCHEDYDRPILIKRYTCNNKDSLEMAINDVVLSTQLNKHNNMLRLLGCCLETRIPILVFQFPHCGNLRKHIGTDNTIQGHPLLSWKSRLEVAKGIEDEIAYLHWGLSKPIVHKNLGPKCIFLDNNFVAKVTDFSLSLSIPLGKDHVEVDRISGHYRYMAYEYALYGRVTEMVDVFAFGNVLLEILLGETFVQISINPDEKLRQLSRTDTNENSNLSDSPHCTSTEGEVFAFEDVPARACLRAEVLAGAD
ncbi:Serine-threonine/tyrosine-protein kinase, catalytic domain [Dillenia turbinata]|uniref:Serine-threonine/tyrosine-protein kinase, catalytic domain n=1 Tax=Dillenia turbinata TaxID=194707 RepID=A0AAN8UNU3_9MAGN